MQQKTNNHTMSIEKFSSAERLFQNKYRKQSARATWHNYNGGVYFITICTKNHTHYFGEIDNGVMHLNEIGKFTFENLQNVNAHYPYAEIPSFIVMPNHIHAIVFIDGEKYGNVEKCTNGCYCRDEARLVSTGVRGIDKNLDKNEKMRKISHRQSLLSNTVGGIKSAVTKFANNNNIDFVWQTRFHDHIIRSQDEINRIAEYIENNPAGWNNDCFNKQ
jgi:REP element-mobilizing transposase RayT